MTILTESPTFQKDLNKVLSLQKKAQLLFWLSTPFLAGVLIEMVRSVPGALYKIYETDQITKGEIQQLVPAFIFFNIWHWFSYFPAEILTQEMEWRNFNLGLPIRYGFPERFISHINAMHIRLRRPPKK